MSGNTPRQFDRRTMLKGAVASSAAILGGLATTPAAAQPAASPVPSSVAGEAAADPLLIQRENAQEGALDWQLTRVRLDKVGGFRSPWIEGYCSRQSVQAGEALDIMVSTDPPGRFTIEIFRTGYYGGRGARLMTTLGPFAGQAQPVPPVGEKRLRECRWEPAARLVIPKDWPSGVYLGRLSLVPDEQTGGYWQSYVVFIVRDNRPADILFQCSDNTWQAYNRWPDNYSVYTDPKGGQGPWSDVSFDRPYAKYAQIYENPQSLGSGEWLCFEFPFAYWLEQHGYDVTYCSNSDMLTSEHGLKCKAFLSVGHDEYWDIRAYESVVAMRDAGVNVMFFSGNSVCWVTPLRRQRRAAQPDHVPRRPLRRQLCVRRAAGERARPVSASRAGRRVPDRFTQRRPGQRRRRLDRRPARSLDLRRHRHEARRPRSRLDRLGVPRRPAQGLAGLGSRRRGHRAARRRQPAALDGHDLSGPQGQLRVQRLDDFLVPGPVQPARPHAALVALEPPPRAGRPRPADHAELVGASGAQPQGG